MHARWGLLGLWCAAAVVQADADLIISNARILTQDAARPHAEAIAVGAGRILAVGSTEEVMRQRGAATTLFDAAGATLLPGLVDAHSHPVSSSTQVDDCSLDDKPLVVAQIAAVAQRCLAAQPLAPGDWLVINNLNSSAFEADHGALDSVVADRPLALLGSDGHTAWVNSRGLALTGIGADTPEPEHGRIVRDAGGNPTGHFIDGGQQRLHEVLPKDTIETKIEATAKALASMQAAGITAVLDASVNAGELEVYRRLAQAGRLVPRVAVALEADVDRGAASIVEMRGWREEFGKVPRLRVDTVKIFADGVLEFPTQSAALLEPYLDASGKPTSRKGKVYAEPAAFAAFVRACAEEGFSVHVHAIGDAAVRASLDAFEAARADAASSGTRFSMSHLQLIHPDDWPRFGALGVFASFQLLWAQPNNYSIEAVEPYIGAAQMQYMYPARGIQQAGGTLVGGSDWNVSSFNPFEAIWVGHTRMNPDEPARGALVPAQAVSVASLLSAYTIDAARMLGMEREIGSLEAGKAADMVLVDRDLLAPDADLRHTRVLGTLIDGRWVYRAPEGT